MNFGQRIVVVIGLGVGLMTFGEWATTPGVYGWVAFAPLSNSGRYSPLEGGLHPWVRLLIWLVLVVVWVVASCVLLRTRSTPEP